MKRRWCTSATVALIALAIAYPACAEAGSTPPIPGLRNYVYVNLSRELLYEVHAGIVTDVLPVSSGGGYRYVSRDGVSRLAVTPVGRFTIYRKIPGWHHSYLGSMFYPSYFDGGYAIHGDTYVPRVPVSHGCIRIPMWAAIGFYERNPIGTPVFVVR